MPVMVGDLDLWMTPKLRAFLARLRRRLQKTKRLIAKRARWPDPA
jgi:hypothetical protein